MNKLTCEMCGSNDLIKEGGCFVYQMCGTKYSVEEEKYNEYKRDMLE